MGLTTNMIIINPNPNFFEKYASKRELKLFQENGLTGMPVIHEKPETELKFSLKIRLV